MIFLSILHQESDQLKSILNQWGSHLPVDIAPHRRAVRALLHEMLTKELQLPAGGYRLAVDANGRPFLEGDTGIALPAISLSHSGGWITCAAQAESTADRGIGLDLERAKTGRDHLALAEAAFGPTEIAAVQAGGSGAFYRIWTLREAWSKATGAGFVALTDRLDHVPLPLLEDAVSKTSTTAGWHWWSARLRSDLQMALVTFETVTPETSRTANRSTPEIWKCHVSSELDLDGVIFHKSNETSDVYGKPGRDDAAT
ncbi:MAG TPA: 4'-phosphopantetheinyl transferase superfamily protein [Terriglobales bacterium]|nr:4'-phosphopantetheinyl transferase superfamily protein [Terriglobales bacterium]